MAAVDSRSMRSLQAIRTSSALRGRSRLHDDLNAGRLAKGDEAGQVARGSAARSGTCTGCGDRPHTAGSRLEHGAARTKSHPGRRLLQQPREPAVLEHAALGLAGRAVGDHVVLEVDRAQRRRRSAGTARPRGGGPAAASAACRGSAARSPARSARSPPPSVATIASRRRRGSSASRSAPRLYGESRASHRISSTHERPMPAITCWSRSSACSGRGASSSS